MNTAWAIYLRVSSEDKQHPERSIPRQQRQIETVLLTDSNLPLFREYTDYVSGLQVDRSDYQQLLTDARSGLFSHLALAEAARFGRDFEEWTRSLRELIKLGVKIKPADMPSLDVDTPDGFFIAVIQGALAEREVRVLGQRVQSGMQEKLRAGGWPFKSPDGYVNKKREVSSGKWDAWVEVDPERGPIHSLIFDLYGTHQYTLLTLAKELNHREYRLPNGEPWSKQAVHRRLTNPFYVGRVESKTWSLSVEGKHEALVDKETWEKCQGILRKQASAQADTVRFRHQKRVYPLVGILWSAETDGPFYGNTCRGQRSDWISYYRTRDKWQGSQIYVQVKLVHEQISQLLKEINITDEVAQALHRLYRQEIDREVKRWFREGEPQHLRQRIAELEGEKAALLRFALKELVSEEEFACEKKRIKDHITRLQDKLATIKENQQDVNSLLDRKLKLLGRAGELWKQASPLQQRALGRGLFERIVIDKKGELVGQTWIRSTEMDMDKDGLGILRWVLQISTLLEDIVYKTAQK